MLNQDRPSEIPAIDKRIAKDREDRALFRIERRSLAHESLSQKITVAYTSIIFSFFVSLVTFVNFSAISLSFSLSFSLSCF